MYAYSLGAQKYIKQQLIILKGETDKNTIIVGDINIPLTALDISSKLKIHKEKSALSDTLYQIGMIDIYRTSDYTFFSSHVEHSQGYTI